MRAWLLAGMLAVVGLAGIFATTPVAAACTTDSTTLGPVYMQETDCTGGCSSNSQDYGASQQVTNGRYIGAGYEVHSDCTGAFGCSAFVEVLTIDQTVPIIPYCVTL